MTTLLVLVLSSLACGQIVLTPTPTAPAAPVASSSPAPLPSTPALIRTAAAVQLAVVVPAAVNIRSSPGGDVVGTLRAGDAVRILQCDYNICGDEWSRIEAGDLSGYIFSGCLSVNPQGLGCRQDN